MSAYYNEFDPFAAEWLRELIKNGLIAEGEVDERSIVDVAPEDLRGFTQCHFFAGIGGWSLAARLAGWPDDRPMWTGSPPCQPFSVAGKRKGKDDLRHLWPVFFNLIRECQPPVVFGEQVAPAIRHGWFDDLRHDMEAEGYATGMVVLPACSVGSPQRRDRLFYASSRLADTNSEGFSWGKQVHDSNKEIVGWEKSSHGSGSEQGDDVEYVQGYDGKWYTIPNKPVLQPMADGISNRVGLLRGAGNAIVPQVGAEVIKAFMDTKGVSSET
jgi:DNA (cytosine-5)-methyltransferase 1